AAPELQDPKPSLKQAPTEAPPPAHSTVLASDAGAKPVISKRKRKAPNLSAGPAASPTPTKPPPPNSDPGISKSNPYRK
ncbi:MAG TPA: hypothetical protein PKD61_17905, partial [Polyangiaceae bacterium]|nr:hypothetical protein [Polyangiaceae bacterium]